MNYTHFVSVAGLVTDDRENILLVKSPRRGWEYPGGLVEPGETFQDALIREIKEESGIEVKITGFIGLCKNIEKDSVNIDFTCKPIGGRLATSDESTEVMWVNKEKALEMITFPLTRKRLENMLSGSEQVNCFCFKKEPFEIVSEDCYSVGNK
ncbi:MAG: NUDIX domain-containing protein [Oscillospiraceae bacterium]|nr:NUDIX domain-containing protein [Oscillospiraceae bacterium]